MFTTLIVQPIFNLLVLIYALLPGHNFGVAIILFTILIRLLMWPLVKKQLHHAKAMRALQPELKRIKKAAGGNRQKESTMVMELYKEREINPFASIGLLIVQIPILIALYSGLQKIVHDPSTLVSFSYPFVQNLSWMKELATNISLFDATFLGIVDLTKPALQAGGGIYWPAMIIVVASAVTQYFQSKQLLPNSKDSMSLRQILRSAGDGKKTDQSDINAAVGRSTQFFIPIMVFFFTINIASALSLYWLTSGLVAIIQQSRVLKDDEEELEGKTTAKDTKTNEVIEGEVIQAKKAKTSKKKKTNKRRKKIVEESISYAKKYLEDLLSFFGLNTDIYATKGDDDIIELHVPSTHLNGFLIGQRGDTLRSIQFLVGSALRNNNYEQTRVHIDVADYKKQRAERLSDRAGAWVKQVKDSGEPMELKPMSAADRRTIHKLATDEGLETESVGEGRDRHIILKPSIADSQ